MAGRQDGQKRVPEVTRRVTISQTTTGQPTRMTGSSEMRIPFDYLFLRPAGPREGDVVFDASDFDSIATRVWAVYFFL
jgi:hypothetical protein